MPPFADPMILESSCSSLELSYENDVATKMPLQKSVRFADFDEVVEIKHINDMTANEIADMWMSNEEHQAVRSEARSIVEMMNAQQDDSDGSALEGLCLRGLDQHKRSYTDRSKAAIHQMYDIVDECQTFEDTHGVRVPEELLAKYLMAVSVESRAQAIARALKDMADARI
mmetsp:Transcript_5211/g.8229  ORF Transcript_5211/g.8229 Transcript_5211/m.8229 type:complete len:171 (+) Transcript_5211:56-568(+)